LRVIEKREALQLLEQHTRELLNDRQGCVMCALVERRDRTLTLQENESGVVLLDRFGSRPGHLLVVSRKHVESVSDFRWQEFSELQRLGFDACRVLERTLGPKRVYMAALGASTALSTSFPHYHLHVVPIHDDDERARPAQVFSWSSGIVVYEGTEAPELVATLRRAWPKPDPSAPTPLLRSDSSAE